MTKLYLFLKGSFIFILYVEIACIYVYYMHAGAHGGQKRMSDLPELELQL